MKLKNFMLLAALASIGFASCGGDDDNKASGEGTSLESQVKKVCDMRCELDALEERWKAGEDVEAEGKKLSGELENQVKELDEKYGPDSDASEEDMKAYLEAMEDCKCE